MSLLLYFWSTVFGMPLLLLFQKSLKNFPLLVGPPVCFLNVLRRRKFFWYFSFFSKTLSNEIWLGYAYYLQSLLYRQQDKVWKELCIQRYFFCNLCGSWYFCLWCTWNLTIFFPLNGSGMTNRFSRVWPAVSIICIAQFSQPPGLMTVSFSCISFLSVDPGVGGTKIQDLKFPSQVFFLVCLSILLEALLNSLGLYIGLIPFLSSSRILLYPLIPDFKISFLNSALQFDFLRICIYSFIIPFLSEHECSFLVFKSLLITSCREAVLFCCHGFCVYW